VRISFHAGYLTVEHLRGVWSNAVLSVSLAVLAVSAVALIFANDSVSYQTATNHENVENILYSRFAKWGGWRWQS
jgi:hypothetical protein